METLLIAVTIIGALAFLALVGFGIRLIQRITTLADEANALLRQSQELIEELSRQLPPTLRSIHELSQTATETLDNLNAKLEPLSEGFEQFRQISQRINYLEHRLQEKIEGPLLDAAKVIAGLGKAIKVFTNSFLNRR